jgi:site-specific recombinase XerD
MRGTPFTVSGFRRIVERACQDTKLDIKAHPHMLRHVCGYELANKGTDTRTIQAYLGHPEHQQHGALHRAVGNTVQRFVPRLRRPGTERA